MRSLIKKAGCVTQSPPHIQHCADSPLEGTALLLAHKFDQCQIGLCFFGNGKGDRTPSFPGCYKNLLNKSIVFQNIEIPSFENCVSPHFIIKKISCGFDLTLFFCFPKWKCLCLVSCSVFSCVGLLYFHKYSFVSLIYSRSMIKLNLVSHKLKQLQRAPPFYAH